MKTHISIIILLSSLFFLTKINAQEAAIIPPENADQLEMIGRYINGKAELRWYPANAQKWEIANKNGYTLERMELTETGGEMNWEKVNSKPIKPFSKSEWDAKVPTNNKYCKVAKYAIHEPNALPPRNSDWEALKNYQEGLENMLMFFTVATDLDATASLASGLRFEDSTIESGKPYAYRLTINNLKKTSAADTALVILEDTKTAYKAPQVEGVRTQSEESRVTILWDASQNDLFFPMYHVERSKDGQNFSRINKLPIWMAAEVDENFHRDTVPNDESYFYRVIGITPFGDLGTPSESVKGMATDKTPAMGATNIRANGNRKSIEVTWDLLTESADLEGFMIGRSANSEGPFHYLNEKPLPKSTRNFIDNSPVVFEPFYIVHAIDRAGNISHAFATLAVIEDDEAPVSPIGLRGEIDTSGVVTIQWEANTEADLMGYHVFTANGKEDVYNSITSYPTKYNFIRDTVNMKALNKEVYYKITALDYNNNPSPYSEILILKRPDIIPPAAPSIYKYNVEEGVVSLKWHNSSSDDVVEHILMRKKEGERETEELITFKNTLEIFVDNEVEMGSSYQYFLIAKDDSGNSTNSTPLNLSVYDNGRRPEIENLKIELDDTKKTAQLTWTYTESGEDFRFIIYKGVDEMPLESYKSVGSERLEYQDLIRKNGAYKYAVKVIYEDGGESLLSEVVALEVSGK